MSGDPFIKNLYLSACKYIPKKFLYHADYFKLISVLNSSKEIQLEVIKNQLRFVIESALFFTPFYQGKLNISVSELKNEDPFDLLSMFSVITKDDVVNNSALFLSSKYANRHLISSSSSGSTGHGITMLRTKRIADIEKAFFTHEWGKHGFNFDKSRIVRVGQDALKSKGQPATWLLGNRLMLSPAHIQEESFDEIRRAILKFNPDYIHGYPGCISALAQLYEDRSLHFDVKAVLLASEPTFNSQAAIISRVFSRDLSINYGLTERTNLAFAHKTDDGISPFKFNPLYGVTDFIKDDYGYQIVGTSLWNDVMPLIKYASNDYVQLSGDVVESIDGRKQSFLVAKDGSKIPSLILDDVPWSLIHRIRLKQEKAGCITLFVKLKSSAAAAVAIPYIKSMQESKWGGWFDVEVIEVDEISVSNSGKLHLVDF